MSKPLTCMIATACLAVACAGPNGSAVDPDDRERERAEQSDRDDPRRHEPIQPPRRSPRSY